jgi:hypothetical protein
VEGAIGGPKSLDSDFEEPKHSVFEKKWVLRWELEVADKFSFFFSLLAVTMV